MRSPARTLGVLAFVGFAVPTIVYFWCIHRFGVNVIWGDQWTDVRIVGRTGAGTLDFATLWRQHAEARMFFPNLLVALLSRTSDFDTVDEMYIAALLLVSAIALLIAAHRRRSPTTQWIVYCPVALMMLSIVQFQNTLWGFQVAWYMAIAALVAAVFFLDRAELGGVALAAAIGAGVVGSVSLFQGLLIWPVGLLLLYLRGRNRRSALVWIAAAAATTGAYFVHFSRDAASPGGAYALHHPDIAAKFFLTALGSVTGEATTTAKGNTSVMLLGACILVIAMWVLLTAVFERSRDDPGAVGVALVFFGVLFAASIAAGRSSFGLPKAGWSVYTTCDLLVLVGAYLAVLGRPRAVGRNPRLALAAGWAVRALLAVIICTQIVLGYRNGLDGSRIAYRTAVTAQDVIANIDHAPDNIVYNIYFIGPAKDVRELEPILRRSQKSLFASSAPARFRSVGLVFGVWAGDQRSPVTPHRGLHAGQTVAIDGRYFAPNARERFSLMECTAGALAGDYKACAPASVVASSSASGRVRARFTVTTGSVGDGSCMPGDRCYIAIRDATDPYLLSFAEIDFAVP